MNPEEILAPVSLTNHLPPEPTSPAEDLAWIRRQEKRGMLTQRTIDLTNAKWRMRYIQIYRKENA